MPDLKTHCKISKQRTYSKFEDLHKWIDESNNYIGKNHRIERHSYTTDYENFIKKKWGEKGVVEWLFHLALDNMDTAFKLSKKAYAKEQIYDMILFEFDKETGDLLCRFGLDKDRHKWFKFFNPEF